MIDAYDNGVADFLAFGKSISKQVRTSAAIDSAIEFAAEELTKEFGVMADQRSLVDPTIEHVYDWGMQGNFAGRLWAANFTSTRGQRKVGFEFLPSRKEVPVPEREPGPKGQQLQGGHVFRWKAIISEYAMPVVIGRKSADWLAFPVNGDGYRNGLVFAKGPIRMNSVSYHNLAFTRMWQSWWSGGGADEVFAASVAPKLEKPWDSKKLRQTGMGRTMKKNVGFRVSGVSGDRMAQQYLNAVARNYERMT